MDVLFIGIIAFLFALAIFDLCVGVSNDAVNFLSSAIGSKAAGFRTIIIIAAVGIFVGASMSNGMMDIARHGIFRPEQFSFMNLICIFMAVMVTDIILLDVFNSLGLPTSTTVSMVFELLGATFAISLFLLAGNDTGLTFAHLLNTEKALSVIIGIFLSVAIAFFFGWLVQWLTRLWFTFNYKKNSWWKIGLFGGLSLTAIVYFLLLKGAKNLTFMTGDVKAWVSANTGALMVGCFVFFTVLMQTLHFLKVNVFKIIVMAGTFALAMAFAGNDLVNFLGVPLTGFDAYLDYRANGMGDPNNFMMGSLNRPASTPVYFLLAAGAIMVIALATSKKARKVVKTSVNLSSQTTEDEMFGSSKVARRLVRWSIRTAEKTVNATPTPIRAWIDRRFDTCETVMEDGTAFDLVRASINLVLAGLLIAIGTSLKLPLSTTYVTFMVAMGTSLADRAWSRESAVFRITGVISVIGGWFITAGAAFIASGLIAALMHLGGLAVIFLLTAVALWLLVWSNQYKKKEKKAADNTLFQTIVQTDNPEEAWRLLKIYLRENQKEFLQCAINTQTGITGGFLTYNTRTLGKQVTYLAKHKRLLKNTVKKSALALKRIPMETAIENGTWFHLSNNSQLSMFYNLQRIAEISHEHVDNNFRQLPESMIPRAEYLCGRINDMLRDSLVCIGHANADDIATLRLQCNALKDDISAECHRIHDIIRQDDPANMTVLLVYLNMMQEQQELVSNLRKLLRADGKMFANQNHPQ